MYSRVMALHFSTLTPFTAHSYNTAMGMGMVMEMAMAMVMAIVMVI